MALYVAKVSDAFIRKLAQEYLAEYMTMEKLAKAYRTTATTISNILFRGVSEGIIDELTSAAITAKVVAFTENVCQTSRRWQKANNLYQAKLVEADIAYTKQCLQEVNYHIESYDDFFFNDDSAPTKKSLKCKRAEIQQRLRTLEQRLKTLKG